MLAANVSEPYGLLMRVVVYAAALVFTAIPICGAVKCAMISRRPTTNTKGALSLAALCAAFGVPGLLVLVIFLLAALSDQQTVRNIVCMGATILILLLLGVTAIMAILALVEIKRDTEGAYLQGRRQAVWALATSMFLVWIVFPFGGAIMQEVHQRQLARSLEGTAADSDLKTLGDFLANKPVRDAVVKHDDLNFQLRSLDSAWVSIDAKHLFRDATVAYVRKWPEMYFTVIAEAPGTETNTTLDGLQDFTRASLMAATPTAKFLDQRPYKLHNLQGVRIVSQASPNNYKFIYVRWIFTRNGYVYQLVTFGRLEDRTTVEEQADRAFQSFELIDPDRVCHVKGFVPLENLTSAEYGINLQMASSGWRAWNDLAAKYPSAEFGGLRGNDEGMVVIPVDCSDLQIPLEARWEAFLSIVGCTQPQQVVAQRKECPPVDGAACSECSFQTPPERGNLAYQLALVQNGNNAYCIAAWSSQSSQQAADALTDLLARVHFTNSADPAAANLTATNSNATNPGISRTFSGAQKQRQAKFFNFAGLYFYRSQQWESSQPYFRKALENDPTLAAALVNYVDVCLAENRFQPAVDAIQQHSELCANNQELQMSYAWALSKTNRPEKALRKYEDVFQHGARNDDHFTAYIRLLEDAGRREEALAAIDHYLAAGDSLTVTVAKARCLSALGGLGTVEDATSGLAGQCANCVRID